MGIEIAVDWKSDFPKARKAALVTDSNVDRLYGDAIVRQIEETGLQVERIVFPAGEKSKTLETYAELVRGFAALELTRTDFAIALGGGVVGDLTGFAAATYMRGIGFVQIPTTLLAMVDSSIGGKTGVDIPEGKNLVGAFHLPKKIIRDVKFLETLPEKEMKNGLAEMIKTAVLFDKEMFGELESIGSVGSIESAGSAGSTESAGSAGSIGSVRSAGSIESVGSAGSTKANESVGAVQTLKSLQTLETLKTLSSFVERCAEWKQKIVDEDFKEGGKRKLLNLGHTFGHAIEAASDFRLGHGECVAIGMRIVGRDVPELGKILDLYGFSRLECGPRSFFVISGEGAASPLELDREKVMALLTNDKKRSGDTITLVVPRKVGECELVETPMSDLGRWLA